MTRYRKGNKTMTSNVDDDDLAPVAGRLLASLASSWNDGDSDSYAAHFHPDADFVDVLGRFFRGREVIARIHRRNFDTIHLGSHLEFEPLSVEKLGKRLALVHARSSLQVPAGPLAGDSTATQTWILQKDDGGWQVRAVHNTFVREMPGVPAVE